MRLGRGPECAKKTATTRSARIDALTRVADACGPDAEYAAQILRRIDAGRTLSTRMKRYRDQLTGASAPNLVGTTNTRQQATLEA